MEKLNLFRVLLGVFIIIAVGATGYYIGLKSTPPPPAYQTKTDAPKPGQREIREGGYNFISPLLECDCYEPSKQVANVILEANIRDYIQKVKSEGKATHVSVYFRDLNNGPWIGISEDELFSPASLLKVPIMIGALKRAEAEPNFLKRKYKYLKEMDDGFSQTTDDGITLEPGKKYDVEYLIHRMIVFSDNRAKNLLVVALGMPFLDKVMTDIQVKVEGTRSPNDLCSVKEYSSFFRLLYNASYLNKEMSEKALRYLSQSTFKDGITAGLPPGTKVAHKFGERGVEGSGNLQLHDCGIVYTANTPYLLCIMTRSTSRQTLGPIIADISKMVHEAVSQPK